ncbi:MAG: outer membrane lipoprotein-sorting protein [Pseudomonadota bacterium]
MKRLLLLLLFVATPLHAAPDAQALLERADQARGGGLPGIVWEIRIQAREGDRQLEPQRIEVRAVDEASVAETLEPARFRGAKILQVGRNMWLTKSGLAKPIPVSPRQRMTGQASNGDIAATNYAADYTATLAGEDTLDGEPCLILELAAKHKRTTYDRVRYWVSSKREVAVQAEFYSLSGKLLKTARFDYGNEIRFEGRRIPFVSRMVIRDAIIDGETDMRYSNVRVRPVAAAEFELGQMQ